MLSGLFAKSQGTVLSLLKVEGAALKILPVDADNAHIVSRKETTFSAEKRRTIE
jgi:hypothetical protein